MIEGPKRAPSSPPETPVPINRMPFAARSLERRFESVKSEFPPSMIMSPASRWGNKCSIIWSTVSPALTINITRRGRFSRLVSSSIVCAPTTWVPLASSAKKSSTLDTVRLKTATLKPWSFMLRTKFCPMTARPIRPISQIGSGIQSPNELLVDAAGEEASIDDEGLAGYKRGGIGGQIDGGSDQLFGLAKPAHGRAHEKFLAAWRAVEQ